MKKICVLFGFVTLLTGCAGNLSPVGYGLITNVKGPIIATENVTGSKQGEACAHNILGLAAFGDASIATAKKKANITRVSTADYASNGFYPFVGQTCVIVTGE